MQWLITDWLGPNNQAVRQDVRAHVQGAFVWEKGAQQVPRLRSPGFPVGLLALANLMRLSLLKAAHGVMDGGTYRKSGSG